MLSKAKQKKKQWKKTGKIKEGPKMLNFGASKPEVGWLLGP